MAAIDASWDTHKLKRGDDIASSLDHTISGSCIGIPIFSTNFAVFALWLTEVSLMCRLTQSLIVFLFYGVILTQVRYPDSGKFSKIFKKK
eukprot:Gb_04202 [translate_table: standard]